MTDKICGAPCNLSIAFIRWDLLPQGQTSTFDRLTVQVLSTYMLSTLRVQHYHRLKFIVNGISYVQQTDKMSTCFSRKYQVVYNTRVLF